MNEENTLMNEETSVESKFTGGALANFGVGLAVLFVSLITLGLAYPAMRCWQLRWECEHTFYDGKQLVFDGRGMQYFGLVIKIFFLSLITLGIYMLIWGSVAMVKWQTQHTHFVGEEEAVSEFDGKWYELLGVSFVAAFVTAITLGIGYFWAHCYSVNWEYKHQVISGQRLMFNGKAMEYFLACIKWLLLTIVTLGIYSFWLAVKTKNWTCSRSHIVPADVTVVL